MHSDSTLFISFGSQISWWMLDLWFGLDASGFDNAGKVLPVFWFGYIEPTLYSAISSRFWATYDDNIRVLEQHASPDWCVFIWLLWTEKN